MCPPQERIAQSPTNFSLRGGQIELSAVTATGVDDVIMPAPDHAD
jgi:hypothetical protein